MDYGIYCLKRFGTKKKFFRLSSLNINIIHKSSDMCSITTTKRSDYDKNDDAVYTIDVNIPTKVCLDIVKLISNKYTAAQLKSFFESTRKGYDRHNLTDPILIGAVARLDFSTESKTKRNIPFVAISVF